MKSGLKIRYEIHNILININKFNYSIDHKKNNILLNNYSQRDKDFIINVCLTTMRYFFHINNILKKYVKKNNKIHQKILLMSAVCQIVFLNFKEYAVIDCSVEISKKLKIFPGLINSVLKNISKNKSELKNISINYEVFPTWFKKEFINESIEKKKTFLKNFYSKPNLHIVFKSDLQLRKFEKKVIKTSELSGFIEDETDKIFTLSSFRNGDWWIQDLSSFLPMYTFKKDLRNKEVLDLCAAPGGKSFQAICSKSKVTLNDKNVKRVRILKQNLKRLKFNFDVLNYDALKLNLQNKFDIVILDSPCSSIGTIRRNPEIFFKSRKPEIKKLNLIQKELLEKSKSLVKKNGLIFYMVCSFFYSETIDQVNNFLKNNKQFSMIKINIPKNMLDNFENKKYFATIPSQFKKYNFDGYFAAVLCNNKT